MSLAKKIIVIFSLLGLCLSIGGYAVQRLTVYPAFETYEDQATRGAVARVRDALGAELRSLDVLNTEYSYWDDTYAFVQGEASTFADDYLREAYLEDSDVDLFLIFNEDGKELFSYINGPPGSEIQSLDQLLLEPLGPGHPILGPAQGQDFVLGYLRTKAGLMQLVSYPIVKTSGAGEPLGSLTTGRFLTQEGVSALTRLFTSGIKLLDPKAAALPESVKSARFSLAFDPDSTYVAHDSEPAMGYFQLIDVFAQPAGLFEVSAPESIRPIAATAITWASLLMAGASVLFIFAAWLIARRFVITPINKLTAEITKIRETGELDVDIASHRSDEIGVLAADFAALTSQLKGVQNNLEQARDTALDASRMKSEFLARMSHEIRTPMNGVLGMSEVLRSTPLSSRQEHLVSTLQESGAALMQIINDVLDFSKIEAGKLEVELVETDLKPLIQSTVNAFAEEASSKGIELTLNFASELQGTVFIDQVRIRQVLTNLLGNALKFTEEGAVSLSVSCERPSADTFIANFEVTDTGIGIEDEKKSLIFDSFTQVDGSTTRNYGGTGLGLSISKQLVELMGGTLALASEPGKGSIFSFSLTLASGDCDSPLQGGSGVISTGHVDTVQ